MNERPGMDEFFEEQVIEGESIDLMRYVKGLLKRWWLIGIVTLGVGIPWVLHVRRKPPVYEAEAWISFENVTGAVPQNMVQSRILKLRSRTFAEEVTAELGLTLQMVQQEDKSYLQRKDIFEKFATTKSPVPGNYALRFYPSQRCAIYHGTERLDSVLVEDLVGDTAIYNGLMFSLNPDIVNSRSQVQFYINDFRGTVGSLISRERINTNRTGDLLSIALRDTDPFLAAQTVNMLAGIFIEKSKEMREDASTFIRDYLQRQLEVVQGDLNNSDYQLKTFRDTHLMGLDQETQDAITQMNALNEQYGRFMQYRGELDMLLKKLDPASTEFDPAVSQRYVYRQIARLPAFENDAEMTITRQQLVDVDGARGQLMRNLPETNPNVMELLERQQLLEDKIYQLALGKLDELDKGIAQMKSRMDEYEGQMEKLPEEEMRFIRLSRQRRANEEIYAMLLRRVKEAQIEAAVAPENVSILDPAVPPGFPITGDKRREMIIGVLFGFGLGIGLALLWEVADKSIRTRHDVKRYLRLPILGIIPKVKFDDYELKDSEKAKSVSSQIVTHDYSPTPVGEAYRSLRTNLLFSKSIGPMRSLVIGSVSPGEGKSFTAANLAITLAQQKSKTLLIDTDLRRGVLHNSFNCPKKPGLTNYLTGVVPLESVLNETYIPNLSLITCGSMIPNPSELLGSNRMKRFIEGISKRFGFIIFDTPPLTAATDAVILGTLVDGVAILIKSGKTHREYVQNKLELFRNVQAKIVGVILNCAGVEVAHEGYSYYSY